MTEGFKRFSLFLNCVISHFSTLQLINSSEKLDPKLNVDFFFFSQNDSRVSVFIQSTENYHSCLHDGQSTPKVTFQLKYVIP